MVPSQRIINIQILSSVIQKSKKGDYGNELSLQIMRTFQDVISLFFGKKKSKDPKI